MLQEKKPCAVCGNTATADLRKCMGCKESLCRHCAHEHVCGEDGRPEMVRLLDRYVTDCDDASALTMTEVHGVLVAYLPRRRTISRAGLVALVTLEQQRAKRVEALPKSISEALCGAPLRARGAICIAARGEFNSLFAAKEADTPEVFAQLRLLMDAQRLANV